MLISNPSIALSALIFSSATLSAPTIHAGHSSRRSTHYPDFVHPSNGDCQDYLINSTVTYTEFHWNEIVYKNNYDVASLLTKAAISAKVPFIPFDGNHTETKTFQIAGTFCKPKELQGGKESTVLVATHGIGFDRRYWASSFEPENYSFAQYALGAGYSVFYYDRLGVGLSSRVDGYEIEADAQIELLAELLRSLRKGDYALDVKPKDVVLIGHSYGSALTNYILGRYPELADAAVLTGFSFANPNVSIDIASAVSGFGLTVFDSRIVSTLPEESKPEFADSFGDGWVSFGDKYAFTEAFLGAEDYEVVAAEYSFTIAQPYSIVDFLSGLAQSSIVDKFKGKVLLAPAERDLFFCAGDCKSTFEKGVQQAAFPNLEIGKDISVYFQEKSGHGQNFAANAKDMYAAVVKFVDEL